MTITALPSAPSRSSSPTTFANDADALLGALPTFVTEINNELAAVNASNGSLPISIPLTFSTTTTDGDPGAGVIRFNNATQTSTTQMFIDLTSAASGNPDITSLLDWLDDSTSTTSKGVIKLYVTATPTTYMYFSLTSWTTATGYRKLTVAHLASSGTSPVFSNSAALTFQFWRTGDAGTVSGALSNANITGVKGIYHNSELSTPGTTGTVNIDWSAGGRYKQAALTGDVTYTFTTPAAAVTNLQLRIIAAAAGKTVAFSGMTIKWLGSTFTATTANKEAFINLFYDGTTYWAQGVSEV